jgi:hypothetical protein
LSNCRICARLRGWLGIEPELTCEALWESHWDQIHSWERTNSNYDELWWQDSERNRGLLDGAHALENSDPEAGIRMLVEAAEAGSAVAMESVAWHFHTGTVVAADFAVAADYYCRAICAGSWAATIGYARLLFWHGHFDDCESLLRDGVRLEFVPAYFWLAQFRYERSPTRATCHQIRPLLDYAVERGHPGAKLTLAKMMLKGRFGIFSIPRGFILLRDTMPPLASPPDRRKVEGLQRRALEAAAQH